MPLGRLDENSAHPPADPRWPSRSEVSSDDGLVMLGYADLCLLSGSWHSAQAIGFVAGAHVGDGHDTIRRFRACGPHQRRERTSERQRQRGGSGRCPRGPSLQQTQTFDTTEREDGVRRIASLELRHLRRSGPRTPLDRTKVCTDL